MTGLSLTEQILRGLSCSYLLVAPHPEMTVVDAAPAFLIEAGKSQAQISGRRLVDIAPTNWLPKNAAATLAELLKTICATGLAQRLALPRSSPNGTDTEAVGTELQLSPIFALDGSIDMILISCANVVGAVQIAAPPAAQNATTNPAADMTKNPTAATASTATVLAPPASTQLPLSAALAESSVATAATAAELGTFEYRSSNGPIYLNDAAAVFFFLKPDERRLTSELFFQSLHPDDRERVRRSIDIAMSRGSRLDTEFRVVTADDRHRWLRVIGRATVGMDGIPQRCNGILIDISREKRTEDALRESEEEARIARGVAEHASLVKDEFLSTLSHELRTPLNTILGWTQVLQRSNSRLSEKASTALATIERSARQQARLIDDLLDASAIIAGKIILDLQPVRCSDIITTSVATCAPSAATRNIKIQVAIDEPGIAVDADVMRLQQVLSRLLSNAIKFSSDDAIIQVRQFASNDKVMITVTDYGQGIAPAFLPSLFARFSQADGSITRTHMGLGLGLSIVKSLIELHGGRVSAASQGVSHGAVFTIELPALIAADTLLPPSLAHDAQINLVDGDRREWSADIVVVDDEPDAGIVMREILQQTGATVRLATSAIEAIEIMRQRRPDLLISDIGMPQIDGYQLLRMVRSQESAEQVPLPAIALTAFARPEDKRRAIEAGYLIHLAKPVESADLITAVKLAVRRPRRSIDIKPK